MTDEKAKEVLQEQIDKYGQEYDAEGIEALEIAIKRLEQTELNPSYNGVKSELEPYEDCISRQEALKCSHIEYDDDGVGHRVIYAEDIEKLPPVTPQQIDKIENSNYSEEQYKADLQGAYDCGYNCGYADAMNDIAEREGKE